MSAPVSGSSIVGALVISLVLFAGHPVDSAAQTKQKSAGKAALLSIALPGLGHRYANDSRWTTTASIYALADLSTWLGIAGTSWRRSSTIDSYRLLAASGASADIEGKDRRFFLNLATHRSSDDYLESALRNRAWDQLDYVSDASFQWEWTSDSDYFSYRDLREKSESLERRRSVLIAALVTNRALAGITSMLNVRRQNSGQLALGITVLDDTPAVRLAASF